MSNLSKFVASLVLGASLLVPSIALAKIYTKVEVLEILLNNFYTEGYDIETLDCDFDFSTSDLKLALNSAYSDGYVEDAQVRYLGHKYTGLTGWLTKKDDTYYLLTLKGPKSAGEKEYGRITFKAKIKRRNPYGDMKGTITVKRTDSNSFSACSAKSSF
ncbi:MAG: hypothetical protein AAB558_04820 [Patescibacteria group bacterium]